MNTKRNEPIRALAARLAAGAAAALVLAGTAGAAPAQYRTTHRRAPARKAPAKPAAKASAKPAVQGTETCQGSIANLRGVAVPGPQTGIMPVYVRTGEELKRFVIRFTPARAEPATVVTKDGVAVSRAKAPEVLGEEGLSALVTYIPTRYRGSEAFLATKIELSTKPEAGTTNMSANSGNVTTREGMTMEDLVVGTGDEAKVGDKVTVNYTGWLTDGTKFDSSLDRNEPFVFNLGARQVIRGWDLGVQGMKVGGKRKLTIPSELGYGPRGAGGVIPPNATLVFEVDLLRVN